MVAARLGWSVLDSQIVDAVANATRIKPSVVSVYDERVTSWLHRLNRDALRSAAAAAGALCRDEDFFDSDCMAKITREVIEQAYYIGECVIVGRGAQCILEDCPNVFRVFIYAPLDQRLRSVCLRRSEQVDEDLLSRVDSDRARYIHQYFGRRWQDLDLYDLMISSKHGDETTTATILRGLEFTPTRFVAAEMTNNLKE